MSILRKLSEWLLMVAALVLPGFVTLIVLYLLNRDHEDDDWNLF